MRAPAAAARRKTIAAEPKTSHAASDVFEPQASQQHRASRSIDAIRARVVERPVEPEEEGPLGTTKYDPADFDDMLSDVGNGWAVTHQEMFTLSDKAIGKMMGDSYFTALDETPFPLGLQADDSVKLLRVYVRAAELGFLDRSVDERVWRIAWPHDAETVSLLLRAAKAFNVSPTRIPFAGSTLDQYRVRSVDMPEAEIRAALASYDPSLKLVHALADEPLLKSGVMRFLSTSSIPIEVLDSLTDILQLPRVKPSLHLRPLVDRRDSQPLVAKENVTELLEKLSRTDKPGKQLKLLERMQSTDAGAPSFKELLTVIREEIRQGQDWFRNSISWTELSEEQRPRLLAALSADKHPGALAVLAGIFTSSHFVELGTAFEALGMSPAEAAEWVRVTQKVRDSEWGFMDLTEGLVEKTVDFSDFLARVRLLDPDMVDVESLFALVTEAQSSGTERSVATAVATFAAANFRDEIAMKVEQLLDDASKRGMFHDIYSSRTSVPDGTVRELVAAGRGVVESDDAAAIEHFVSWSRAASAYDNPDQAIANVLREVHEHVLSSRPVVPAPKLGWVTAAKASVEAPPVVEQRPRQALWAALSLTPELLASVHSFGELEAFEPSPAAVIAARTKYPALLGQLRRLTNQLIRHANGAETVHADPAVARAKALELIDRSLGEALSAATGDEKVAVFTAGRALLSEFEGAYADLVDRYQSIAEE